MMKGCIRPELISNIDGIHTMIIRINCGRNRQFFGTLTAEYRQGNARVCRGLSGSLSVSQNEVASLVEREGSGNAENEVVVLPGKAEDVVDKSLNVAAVDEWCFEVFQFN